MEGGQFSVLPTLCCLLHPAVDVEPGSIEAFDEVHSLQLSIVMLLGFSQEILKSVNDTLIKSEHPNKITY